MNRHDDHRLARAEAELHDARAGLAHTLDAIQAELAPARLATRALDELRANSRPLADRALETLLSRPVLTAGAALLAGYMLRHKTGVLGMIGRLLVGAAATRTRAAHSESGTRYKG